MHVLYLYSGTRKNKWQGVPGVDFPDTQLYGLNHLSGMGIDAASRELSDFLPKRIVRIVPFRLRHLLLYFTARGYDFVLGSSLLYSMLFQKIFKYKARFVLLNISLSRTLVANRLNRFRLALLRYLLREFSGIVCLSQVQKSFIEQEAAFLKGRVYAVPMGVDVAYHKPVYEGRGEYILSAGRDNGRDYKTVVEAARLMPERGFHIVCSKRNLAGITSVPENVSIFFDISPDDLYKKYQEAHALLMITHGDEHPDGSDCSGQTVLLEAMANGLPIIASRKGYIAEYVEEDKEALLVDCYDTEGIVRKISALDDQGLRGKLSKNARVRAERDFSTPRMAENLARIFKELT